MVEIEKEKLDKDNLLGNYNELIERVRKEIEKVLAHPDRVRLGLTGHPEPVKTFNQAKTIFKDNLGTVTSSKSISDMKELEQRFANITLNSTSASTSRPLKQVRLVGLRGVKKKMFDKTIDRMTKRQDFAKKKKKHSKWAHIMNV